MTKQTKIIGLVGGVGPYAGLDLNTKIFDYTKTNGSDQDHLEVYLLSRSADIKDRSAFLKNEISENPAEGIFRTIQKLISIGSVVIGIPCNTAHSPSIFNQVLRKMADYPGIELCHMINETKSYLASHFPNAKKIGLLATEGTYLSSVYSDILEKDSDLTVLLPDSDKARQRVHDAIYHPQYGIKAFSNPIKKEAINILQQEATQLIKKGVDVIILGCTELPLALSQEKIDDILLIDPTSILAKALIKRAYT